MLSPVLGLLDIAFIVSADSFLLCSTLLSFIEFILISSFEELPFSSSRLKVNFTKNDCSFFDTSLNSFEYFAVILNVFSSLEFSIVPS